MKKLSEGFPALISENNFVNLKVLDNADDALINHYEGVKTLIQLQMKERIKIFKKFPTTIR